MTTTQNITHILLQQQRERQDSLAKVQSVLPTWIETAKEGDIIMLTKGKGGKVHLKVLQVQ